MRRELRTARDGSLPVYDNKESVFPAPAPLEDRTTSESHFRSILDLGRSFDIYGSNGPAAMHSAHWFDHLSSLQQLYNIDGTLLDRTLVRQISQL